MQQELSIEEFQDLVYNNSETYVKNKWNVYLLKKMKKSVSDDDYNSIDHDLCMVILENSPCTASGENRDYLIFQFRQKNKINFRYLYSGNDCLYHIKCNCKDGDTKEHTLCGLYLSDSTPNLSVGDIKHTFMCVYCIYENKNVDHWMFLTIDEYIKALVKQLMECKELPLSFNDTKNFVHLYKYNDDIVHISVESNVALCRSPVKSENRVLTSRGQHKYCYKCICPEPNEEIKNLIDKHNASISGSSLEKSIICFDQRLQAQPPDTSGMSRREKRKFLAQMQNKGNMSG